jgi:hypothetical protein
MGSTREEVYGEANKKYKNGTLLQAAGAAIFVAAGIIIVNRMIQSKKIQRRALAVSPHLLMEPNYSSSRLSANPGISVRYRLR